MLSAQGYRLREVMAEAGFEVTPDELDTALLEAHERISGGPCKFCGIGDEDTELRYGMCFTCFMKDDDGKNQKDGEKEVSKEKDRPGPTTRSGPGTAKG